MSWGYGALCVALLALALRVAFGIGISATAGHVASVLLIAAVWYCIGRAHGAQA